MTFFSKFFRRLGIGLLFFPSILLADIPVKSMVIFGDSLSDTGNTTYLLKSLRQEESPAYLVYPAKIFIINKMIEFAEIHGVPQMVLDKGIELVTEFFDTSVGPLLATLISKINKVPVLPGDPYWQDHFSNGRVWDEYLSTMVHVDREDKRYFTNKAFGGSWAATYDHQLTVWNFIRHPIYSVKNLIIGKLIPPSLGLTVQAYLLVNETLSPDAVYFIFTGGNDYLNLLAFEDNYDPVKIDRYIDNVINSLSASVHKLIKAGARKVIVLGIPEVGVAPRFINSPKRDILNLVSEKHNTLLAANVLEWQSSHPEVDFLFIDIVPILKKALENPGLFGLKNVTEACIDVKLPLFNLLIDSPFKGNFVLEYAQILKYSDKNFALGERNYRICDNPDEYLFWDEVHPTTKAHLFLADEICLQMQAHGYKATCAKLVDG